MNNKKKFGSNLYLLTCNAGKLIIRPYAQKNIIYPSTRINNKRNIIGRMRNKK